MCVCVCVCVYISVVSSRCLKIMVEYYSRIEHMRYLTIEELYGRARFMGIVTFSYCCFYPQIKRVQPSKETNIIIFFAEINL